MNEQNPGAGPIESSPLAVPYKDRSTGLLIFGILTIGLGCLAGLFVLLLFVGQAAAARVTPDQVNFAALLPAVFLYGVLAVALVWLGIGSIMARRWARALLLIFSWSWLVVGLFEIVSMAFIMPKILASLPSAATADQPALPAAAMDAVMFVMFLVLGVMFVIMPAAWTFFYNSRHVKATCENRDPVRRWTDACPLPVLALCLWLLLCVPTIPLTLLFTHGVTPFFGVFLTGVPGAIYYLVVVALWICAARLLYKLDLRGWWLTLIVMGVFMVSSLLTFARHDILEMYRLMDMPEAQIEQIQKTGLLEGNGMKWLMLIFWLPFLGYLLFIKKYFSRKS